MRTTLFFIIVILFLSSKVNSQVGIGTTTPSFSSALDIQSTEAGILIPRISLSSLTDAVTISNGNVESLLVYNTTITPPLSLGYYYWSNAKWNKIANLDDIGASTFVASNGLTINTNQIQLGGNLIQPTEITTSIANTLAITGLEESTSISDKLLLIDPITNVMKTRPTSSNTIKNQSVILATSGQVQFTTPLPTIDFNKIDVYRNGIRVNFTIVGINTIELEPEAICFLNDEVRIVQLL